MKVRIKARPHVPEVDGVDLRSMEPGTLREVSPSIGAWLVAEGYAEPEMRTGQRESKDLNGRGPISGMPDRRSRGRL